MVSLEPIGTLLAWQYLPSFLSARFLDICYKVKPDLQPKTQKQAVQHARASRILVIICYLSWSVISKYLRLSTTPNFYQLLDFPSSASLAHSYAPDEWDSQLKSNWRKFTLRFHPDKLRDQATPELEQYFVLLRSSYETLSDPIKKMAYERFGPTLIDTCSQIKCSSLRDWQYRGFQTSFGFWIVTLGSYVVLSLLGNLRFALYWRYVLLATGFVIEFSLLASPWSFLTALSGLLPFEQILLLHHIFVTGNCVISQLVPVLFPDTQHQRTAQEELQSLVPLVTRLQSNVTMLDNTILVTQNNDLFPLLRTAKNPDKALGRFQDSVVESLCDNRLKNTHPEAWLQALQAHQHQHHPEAAKLEKMDEGTAVKVEHEEISAAASGVPDRQGITIKRDESEEAPGTGNDSPSGSSRSREEPTTTHDPLQPRAV